MSRSPIDRVVVLVALLALLTGCRSASPSGDRTTPRSAIVPAYEFDAITFPESRSVFVDNAYEAVVRFRPEFLEPRRTVTNPSGELPAIYVDGRYQGGVDALRTIPAAVIVQIRYLRPVDANHSFRQFHAGGVILVRTRR